MAAYLPSAPGKIAVLHAKALGDLIVALPALGAIKETYTTAELVLLSRPWVKEFLAIRPSAIDRVINVPALTGVNNAVETTDGVQGVGAGSGSVEVELFCEAMRAEKFDLVIHMQGDGKTVNPLSKSSAAD